MEGIDAAPDNAFDVTYSIAAPQALGGGGAVKPVAAAVVRSP